MYPLKRQAQFQHHAACQFFYSYSSKMNLRFYQLNLAVVLHPLADTGMSFPGKDKCCINASP